MMARRKSLSKYWLYLMTKQVSFTVIYLLLWPHDTKTYLLEDFAAAGGHENSDGNDGSQQHGGSKILNFLTSQAQQKWTNVLNFCSGVKDMTSNKRSCFPRRTRRGKHELLLDVMSLTPNKDIQTCP